VFAYNANAGPLPADGALHRTTAFAKEYWILKD